MAIRAYCGRIVGVVALLLWAMGQPMGEQTPTGTTKDPAFAPLEEGCEDFVGRIKDETRLTELSKISFFGRTDVGGVRREDDDSVTKLDLLQVASIKVIQQVYVSKRYPDKDFAEIQKTAPNGTVTKGLLIPRHIIICGVEKNTGDEKAWYLSKIDELTIDNAQQSDVGPSEKVIEKILKKAEDAMPAKNFKGAQEQVDHHEVATMKERYKDKALRVVDKEPEMISLKKTVTQAVTDLFSAIVELVKALFGFVKNLLW